MKRIAELFRRKPEMPIVVVSGLPRSGTSMMMRMLEAGGIPLLTDNLRTADDDNPRGYFEYERVKKMREGDTAWLPEARGKVVKIISGLVMYLPKEYEYKVLFMQRSIPEVLASQRKMLIHRGEDPDKISDEDMAKYYEKHLAQVSGWLGSQTNIATLYVDYNRMLAQPGPSVHDVNRFLGKCLEEDQMAAIVDPALYRQRK